MSPPRRSTMHSTFLAPYLHHPTFNGCYFYAQTLRYLSTLFGLGTGIFGIREVDCPKQTKDPQRNGSTHDQRSVHKVRTSSFDRRISSISTNYPAQMSVSEAREVGPQPEPQGAGARHASCSTSRGVQGRASVSPLLPPAWERRDQLIGECMQ